jgi:hypothetical protein
MSGLKTSLKKIFCNKQKRKILIQQSTGSSIQTHNNIRKCAIAQYLHSTKLLAIIANEHFVNCRKLQYKKTIFKSENALTFPFVTHSSATIR